MAHDKVDLLDSMSAATSFTEEETEEEKIERLLQEGLKDQDVEKQEMAHQKNVLKDLGKDFSLSVSDVVKNSNRLTEAEKKSIRAEATLKVGTIAIAGGNPRIGQIKTSVGFVKESQEVVNQLREQREELLLEERGMRIAQNGEEVPMGIMEKIASTVGDTFGMSRQDQITRFTQQIAMSTQVANAEIAGQSAQMLLIEEDVKLSAEYLGIKSQAVEAQTVVAMESMDAKGRANTKNLIMERHNMASAVFDSMYKFSNSFNELDGANAWQGLRQFDLTSSQLKAATTAQESQTAMEKATYDNLLTSYEIQKGGDLSKAELNELQQVSHLMSKQKYAEAAAISKKNPLLHNVIATINWGNLTTSAQIEVGNEVWSATAKSNPKSKFLDKTFTAKKVILEKQMLKPDSALAVRLNSIANRQDYPKTVDRQAKIAELITKEAEIAAGTDLLAAQKNSMEFNRKEGQLTPVAAAYVAKTAKESIESGEVLPPKTIATMETAAAYADKNLVSMANFDRYMSNLHDVLVKTKVITPELTHTEEQAVANGMAGVFKGILEGNNLMSRGDDLFSISNNWKLSVDTNIGGINMRGKDLTSPATMLYFIRARKAKTIARENLRKALFNK